MCRNFHERIRLSVCQSPRQHQTVRESCFRRLSKMMGVCAWNTKIFRVNFGVDRPCRAYQYLEIEHWHVLNRVLPTYQTPILTSSVLVKYRFRAPFMSHVSGLSKFVNRGHRAAKNVKNFVYFGSFY